MSARPHCFPWSESLPADPNGHTLLDIQTNWNSRFLSIVKVMPDTIGTNSATMDQFTMYPGELSMPMTYGVTWKFTEYAISQLSLQPQVERLSGINSKDGVQSFLLELAERHPNYFFILRYQTHSENSTSTTTALGFVIDCLPMLSSPKDIEYARKLGFMMSLADEVANALEQDLVALETACSVLAGVFHTERKSCLECRKWSVCYCKSCLCPLSHSSFIVYLTTISNKRSSCIVCMAAFRLKRVEEKLETK